MTPGMDRQDGQDEIEQLISESVARLAPKLLHALEVLGHTARHLHPPALPALVPALSVLVNELEESKNHLSKVSWPEDLALYQQQLVLCAEHILAAIAGMENAVRESNGVRLAYSALRKYTLAVEALYPLTSMLRPISRYFLEPGYRDDESLLDKLTSSNVDGETVGIMHAGNNRDERGGLSIYVPEYYDASKKWPLVVALHGGSGHGADSMWSWLREARARGFIVLSPTSQGATWSLVGEDQDAKTLRRIVSGSCKQWNIDTTRVMLTGMSDGATYTLLNGLLEETAFTHLAPLCGTFHPMLLEGMGSIEKKSIYLVHGLLDWMFPVETARETQASLSAQGASVVYREVEDLSHTYPREINSDILDWFLA